MSILKTPLEENVTGEADQSKDDVQLDQTTEITRRSSRRRKASRVDYKEVSTSDIEDKVNKFVILLLRVTFLFDQVKFLSRNLIQLSRTI